MSWDLDTLPLFSTSRAVKAYQMDLSSSARRSMATGGGGTGCSVNAENPVSGNRLLRQPSAAGAAHEAAAPSAWVRPRSTPGVPRQGSAPLGVLGSAPAVGIPSLSPLDCRGKKRDARFWGSRCVKGTGSRGPSLSLEISGFLSTEKSPPWLRQQLPLLSFKRGASPSSRSTSCARWKGSSPAASGSVTPRKAGWDLTRGRLGWRCHAQPFLHKPLPLRTSGVDVTNKNLLAHSSLCGLCPQPRGTGTHLLG